MIYSLANDKIDLIFILKTRNKLAYCHRKIQKGLPVTIVICCMYVQENVLTAPVPGDSWTGTGTGFNTKKYPGVNL